MITIIVRRYDERFEVHVNDRLALASMLCILDNCPDVIDYKVSLTETGTVTNLYDEFGFGPFRKFVSVFNHPSR